MKISIVCLLVASMAQIAAAQQNPEVIAELDRPWIYEGESVLYRVMLNHVENPSPPKLEGFDEFEVRSLREQSLNSRKIIYKNGRRDEEVVRFGRAYDYRLTPRRTGTLTVPAPVATVDGQVLRGNPLTIEVRDAKEQDMAILELVADRTAVYPMQPFTITLTVAAKALPEPVAHRDPLSVQQRPPALSIPWTDDEQLDEGIEPIVPWRNWLGRLQNRRGQGFTVNNIGGSSVFALFDDRATTFLPDPRRRRRPDQSGRETSYWEYSFSRTFVGKKVGHYKFGPATLEGTFVRSVKGRSLQAEKVYAVAKAITVEVKDVPLEGRPDSYTGAVGNFDVAANLVPTRAQVGDPMTLTLTLRGQGTLASAGPPDLARIPAIAKQFKTYDATADTRNGSREFTYSLRPLAANVKAFPEVPISYFDVDTEKYVTLHTEPIPINVTQADRLSGSEIAMAGPPGGGHTIELQKEGIFANVTGPAALVDDSVRPARWLMGLGGVFGMYLVVLLVTLQARRLENNPALVRRRGAGQRARRRIREAVAELESERYREAADHVRGALVGLVADVAHLPEAGLTSADAVRQLAALDVEQSLVDRLAKLLETCDGARYGASQDALHGLGETADALLNDLQKALKNRKLS